MRDGGAVEVATEETVSEWFGRMFDWREKRGKRAESVDDSRGRIRKWVTENTSTPLGTTPMKRVTRGMLESFVAYLDEQVDDGVIAPKTATNIFGEAERGLRGRDLVQGEDATRARSEPVRRRRRPGGR